MSWTNGDLLTPANLNAKSGIFNIVTDEAYGVVMGAGTDQTIGLQAALDAGGFVYVPAGTVLAQTLLMRTAGTILILHPDAVLKLPDNHTASAADRTLIKVTAADCKIDCHGLLDGNYANRTGSQEWYGVDVQAANCHISYIRVARASRACVGVNGSAGTPIDNFRCDYFEAEDGLNDGIALQHVTHARIGKVVADDIRYAVGFEDGCVDVSVQAVYATDCTAPFHSVIHSGGTSPITDLHVGYWNAQDCNHFWNHASGEDLDNRRVYIGPGSGDGWTSTDTDLMLLGGFDDITIAAGTHWGTFDGVSKAVAQFSSCNNVRWYDFVYSGNPSREPIHLKNSDNFSILGGKVGAQGEEIIRIEITDGNAHENVRVIDLEFQPSGNEDVVNVIESSGTIADVIFAFCSGIGNGNDPGHAEVKFYKCEGGVGDSATVLSGRFLRFPSATGFDVRQQLIDTNQIAVGDATETTLFTFTVPAQSTAGNSVGARFDLTFILHTSASAGNVMTSVVGITFTVLRQFEVDTVFSAITFTTSVGSAEQGSTGTHTALDVSQFDLDIVSGTNTEDQVIKLDFTNNYDGTVVTALARVCGMMESLVGGNTALPPYWD